MNSGHGTSRNTFEVERFSRILSSKTLPFVSNRAKVESQTAKHFNGLVSRNIFIVISCKADHIIYNSFFHISQENRIPGHTYHNKASISTGKPFQNNINYSYFLYCLTVVTTQFLCTKHPPRLFSRLKKKKITVIVSVISVVHFLFHYPLYKGHKSIIIQIHTK